jgi:hypothetical protein
MLFLADGVYFTRGAAAQKKRVDPSVWGGKPKESPAQTPRRRAAPRQVIRHAPAPSGPQVTLLSAQYRVLKVNANNSQVEVSPVTVFNAGDHLRFAFKTNVDAYLYIIWQEGSGRPAKIYFPDSRFNNGLNNLTKDQEFVIPGACGQGATPYDCAHVLGGSAQELFTVVVSRSPTLNLLNQSVMAGGVVDPRRLEDFVRASVQGLDPARRGDTVFAVCYRNLNPKADDQIVLQYAINKN